MPNSTEQELKRQLALIMAIDTIRDQIDDGDDPSQMFDAIAQVLRETFEAEACAIMTISELTDEIAGIAALGVPQEQAIALCKQAMAKETPQTLETNLWAHTLGIRVVLQEPVPLGGLFIGRDNKPFNDADKQLLEIAESQIDSAILQAHRIWKLANRNRELEAIYKIDRLRDDVADEYNLIYNFTNLLVEHFEAEAAIINVKPYQDEHPLRALAGTLDLSESVQNAIFETADTIRIPQTISIPETLKDKQLLAAPFIVNGARIGAVVVIRDKPYSISDHRLMFAMTSQMDSAIVHARTVSELARRRRELEVIYRIDHIRDVESDFENMIQQVLHELCDIINGEAGYLMLYSAEEENELELKIETSEGQLSAPEYLNTIIHYSREALKRAELVYNNRLNGAIQSIIAVPLILNERIIGVFGAINSTRTYGFSRDDRRILKAITSQVDTAVFERLEIRQMRKVLSRSVDPKVIDLLLQSADSHILAGERVNLSVIFADLRGSTEWAERAAPEEFVTILNQFLAEMTEIIFKHGGTLDKFVGDEVIALFGTPIPMEDHAQRAAAAALEMQKRHQELQAQLAAEGKELPPMGIGISSGEAIAGEFGPPIRTDFTAMGRVMNLGARLCSVASAGEVIVSEETQKLLGNNSIIQTLDPLNLKGIGHAVTAFNLKGLK